MPVPARPPSPSPAQRGGACASDPALPGRRAIKPKALAATLAAVLAAGCPAAAAESWSDRFVDKEDGALDLSDHLINHRGFLPVPIIITEPAVDSGLGAALLYFRDSFSESSGKGATRGQRFARPDIGALFAFETGNGSWGAGGGYSGSLEGDRFRYLGALAKVNLNLDYYGLLDQPRRFSLDAPLLVAQGLARIGESDWFAGARYLYFGGSAEFDLGTPSTIPQRDLEADIGRASLLINYDSRDNHLTPSSGAYAELDIGLARPGLGSSTSFDSIFARSYSYLPLGGDWVLGLRVDGKFTGGDVPFYAKPFVMLRGVPAMRYQGQHAVVAEAEVRYDLTPRWSLVGFGGAARAYGGRVDFSDAENVVAGGAGFRYLTARKLGLYTGLDLARGPEDTVLYIQIGSAWH